MKSAFADLDPMRELLDKAEAAESTNREVLEEIRKARQPNYSQPLNSLRKAGHTPGGLEKGGFSHMGQFLREVVQCGEGMNVDRSPLMKSYLQKALPTGLNETQAMDGGFLVPPNFAQQLLMRTYANDLLSRTTMFPLPAGNSIAIPAINETSRADGSRFGGVQGFWRGESDTVTATKPNLAQIELKVKSLQIIMRPTQELLDDVTGMSLETWMGLVADQELAFKIGDSLVNGDGQVKPLGILNSPSKVAQAAEAGQAANTVVAQNIVKMWSRLHVSARQNAVWLIDQSIEPQLFTMTVGTAGANLVVYMPPGGLSGAPYGTLMGRPVIVTEFGKTLGTEGDIILLDPSTILSAMKGGMQALSSIHIYFLTSEVAFRFTIRIDAKNWWLSALTPKSAGVTQTNIVTLATRP